MDKSMCASYRVFGDSTLFSGINYFFSLVLVLYKYSHDPEELGFIVVNLSNLNS